VRRRRKYRIEPHHTALQFLNVLTADVTILGAGIAGASIAWHLTRAGCRDVLLVERESSQGKGSTGKSMGGVRAQFATAPNIRMSLYSIPMFANFEEHTGHPSGYKSHGYLFCATEPRQLDCLRENQRLQHSLGLAQARMVSREEILGFVPLLRSDDILGGSFCPTDGFVDPWSVMTGFTESALAAGARLLRNSEVQAIDVRQGRIAGVRTSREVVSTRVVVNACGAWASGVAALAGASLPVTPCRRMLVPTEAFPGLPERCPMTIDMSSGFHFRPEGRGLLLAWNDPEESPGFKLSVDPDFVEKILTRAVERVPAFVDLEVDSRKAWAGLYEMSPDHHAILGPAPEVEGLYYANGFSGHGVMHSPATGRILADLILKGGTDLIDAGALSVRRFAEGRAIHESAVL
jgi:sarcosine oxidase subunit beta